MRYLLLATGTNPEDARTEFVSNNPVAIDAALAALFAAMARSAPATDPVIPSEPITAA